MTKLAVRTDGAVLIDKMPSDLRIACAEGWWRVFSTTASVGPFRSRRAALAAIRRLPESWLAVRKGRVAK